MLDTSLGKFDDVGFNLDVSMASLRNTFVTNLQALHTEAPSRTSCW